LKFEDNRIFTMTKKCENAKLSDISHGVFLSISGLKHPPLALNAKYYSYLLTFTNPKVFASVRIGPRTHGNYSFQMKFTRTFWRPSER